MARKTIAQIEAERDILKRDVLDLIAKNAKLREVQITDPKDPRLKDFWKVANEYADENSLCSDYDEFVEAIGGPGREREYRVQNYIVISATGPDEALELAQTLFEDVEKISDYSTDYAEVNY